MPEIRLLSCVFLVMMLPGALLAAPPVLAQINVTPPKIDRERVERRRPGFSSKRFWPFASKFSEMGTGGWNWILSDLKTLLETGAAMGE